MLVRNAEMILKNIVDGICQSRDFKNSFCFNLNERVSCKRDLLHHYIKFYQHETNLERMLNLSNEIVASTDFKSVKNDLKSEIIQL